MAALEAEITDNIPEPEKSGERLHQERDHDEQSGVFPARPSPTEEEIRRNREIIEQFFDKNPHEKTGFTD